MRRRERRRGRWVFPRAPMRRGGHPLLWRGQSYKTMPVCASSLPITTLHDLGTTRSTPDAPARALLLAIERDPEVMRRLLAETAAWSNSVAVTFCAPQTGSCRYRP